MPDLNDVLRQATNGVHEKEKEEHEHDYEHQGEKLGHRRNSKDAEGEAVAAKFVTALDPVVVTADGGRLPVVPVDEAEKLNELKEEVEEDHKSAHAPNGYSNGKLWTSRKHHHERREERQSDCFDAPLHDAIPPSRTNPLFPPLPLYGPPSVLRSIQCFLFRVVSAPLSLAFLICIVIGATFASVPEVCHNVWSRARLKNPRERRPFFEEEMRRKKERKAANDAWMQKQKLQGLRTPSGEKALPDEEEEFFPTEGGPDPLHVDIAYYARRVGLDTERFEVQTEDGFVIELIHLYNPREYKSPPSPNRKIDRADLFRTYSRDSSFAEAQPFSEGNKKYPVLMMHGLLQSAGAFCANDDDSLAFYLAKSGYDVWLGQNRCGFNPKHTLLDYTDPRMWAWNIRQMGVMDLPALIDRVLKETGFLKLALIAHSQGTTQTFVALAKEQRPDIGDKISVFCALAPAAYAGPLISKIYFKVMRLISPAMFRLVFGIHAFIPLMMVAHKILPAKLYSWMGYHVFSHLFSWTDKRWDRELRNRMFQFAPTYVSAESMRWWLGRECFAKQRCILATRDVSMREEKEDEEDDEVIRKAYVDREPSVSSRRKLQRNLSSFHCQTPTHQHHDSTRGRYAWYDLQFPPLALWIAGNDDLVDGRRLLRRFDRGREPHVRVVHRKIIPGYEHLDVIWAMDAIEQVGKEVREVIWRTVDQQTARRCRVPVGCKGKLEDEIDVADEVPMLHSGGRQRMASISEGLPSLDLLGRSDGGSATVVDGESVRSGRARTFSIREEPEKEEKAETEEDVAADTMAGVDGEDGPALERVLSEPKFTDVHEKSDPFG